MYPLVWARTFKIKTSFRGISLIFHNQGVMLSYCLVLVQSENLDQVQNNFSEIINTLSKLEIPLPLRNIWTIFLK